MRSPDQLLFETDLGDAPFRAGALKDRWGCADPKAFAWPHVLLWLSAAPRPNAPDRFFIRLDAAGYRAVPCTGTLWDPDAARPLDFGRFPKGKPGGRVEKVFRTDSWAEQNRALYHPYDRVAAQGHPNWIVEHPNTVWNASRTIVDYLDDLQRLLNGDDYVGI